MKENKNTDSVEMEDISSTSKEFRKRNSGPVAAYGNGLFKGLGTIIKTIAFLIAFAIIGVSFVLAYFLYSAEALYIAISLAIIIFGTLVAAITFFLIYGLGHIICQNNEILRRLNERY